MNNEVTATNPKNENLQAFVSAVSDMEIRRFTLSESAQRMKKTAARMDSETTSCLKSAEESFKIWSENKRNSQDSINSISTYRKYRALERSVARFFGELITFIFVFFFTGGIASILLSGLLGMLILETDFVPNVIFMIPLLIISAVIYYLIFRAIQNSERLDSIKNYKKELEKATEQYNKAEQYLEKCKKDRLEADVNVPALMQKSDELEAAAAAIKKDLEGCYAMDIIPPSYRNLVCTALIDDIFRNNKADTMKEAVILCDVELRHAEVVNKLNDINDSLKSLGNNIRAMNDLLQSINSNIASISSDVSSISHNQGRIAYATESMQKSSDNLDFYIAQKRAGAL